MERIMNKENDLDRNAAGDALVGTVVCVSREEVLQTLNELKTGIAPVVSEVSLELIDTSGGVGIYVMAELCLSVLGGFGMPIEWALSIVVPIFKGMGDFRNSSCC